VVLDAYPVKSIKKIDGGLFNSGPWKKKRITVAHIDLSLDDIEHEILRVYFPDPRIHYAVNCASVGCPDLAIDAYTGDNLADMLTRGAVAYINHPRGAQVNDGKLYVSSIFSWYAGDFGGSDQAIIDHMKIYAKPALASTLQGVTRISGDDYDWQLNGR
jgi:hypothetical protein